MRRYIPKVSTWPPFIRGGYLTRCGVVPRKMFGLFEAFRSARSTGLPTRPSSPSTVLYLFVPRCFLQQLPTPIMKKNSIAFALFETATEYIEECTTGPGRILSANGEKFAEANK